VDHKEWRWEGDLWSFIEIVQWALVFHQLGKEPSPDFSEIMASPEGVRSKAEEYGMTWRAIAKEMIRCGNDAMSMLDALNAQHTED
jgi:hypothetical protein